MWSDIKQYLLKRYLALLTVFGPPHHVRTQGEFVEGPKEHMTSHPPGLEARQRDKTTEGSAGHRWAAGPSKTALAAAQSYKNLTKDSLNFSLIFPWYRGVLLHISFCREAQILLGPAAWCRVPPSENYKKNLGALPGNTRNALEQMDEKQRNKILMAAIRPRTIQKQHTNIYTAGINRLRRCYWLKKH